MTISDKFWRQLSTVILWGSISGLLLLFPVMVYLLQPTADIEQKTVRAAVQQQKEILSRLRADTALLTSGYRDDPREEILMQLDKLFASVHQVDSEMVNFTYEATEPAQRSWQRYTSSLPDLQEIILEISSASALYGFSVSQLETVFEQAEQELFSADLPVDLIREYDLALAKTMIQALRHAALPSDASALALEVGTEQIRRSADTLPSVQAQSAFNKVIAYVDGLVEATGRIRTAADHLMALPTYEHLNSFDRRFSQWLAGSQMQQRQSRWTLIVAVVLLISAVAVALIRLKVVQERLLKSNSKLSAYKTAMDEHAIVSITDPAGSIQYINRKFTEISGYAEAELLGQNHRLINSGVHPKEFFKGLWSSVLQGNVWHDEVCNRRKDGSLYWVSATVVPMLNEEQQLESIISVRTDITAIKQTERALTAEKERAEVANKAKSDFLANMSHEIRTPMNAVIGMSHLARQSATDEQVVSYIDKIQQSAQNLLVIINDILDFSKIEAGRLEVEHIPFRLDNVLGHLADLASVRADEKGLPLIFDSDANIPGHLQGDPLRLGQVLLNLVNNAIKFTAEGSITVSVQLLEHEAERVRLRFSVKDTGIGLSREQIGRLFKSFSQADTSTTRQYGGTGLGLAISKQLVELMQGEIGVHSEPDVGSEFFFTLPLQLHEADDVGQIEVSGIRVLAVDDDSVSLEAIANQLSALGVYVETETGAATGLNRLVNAPSMGDAPFNVLLIDWQMPEMDGFQVAKAVRNNSALPWQPAIIMLTGHAGQDLQRRINHALIDSILLKPATPSHLLNTIQDALLKRAKQGNGPSIRSLFREGDEIHAMLGANVLIAEDNAINQEVIVGLLEPYGLNIRLAANGREAVEAVQQEEFDLIFMDIQMPEVDGIQATEQILQMQLLKMPPVVAMTAHAQQEDIQYCLDKGMSDHIAKPVSPEILKEKLIQWIEPRVISGYSAEPLNARSDMDMPFYLYGVNINKALHSLGGNKPLLMKLMAQFCDDYADGLAPIRAMMAEGEWDSLKRWLHTLKGSAGTLGVDQVAQYAASLEQLGFEQTLPSDQELQPLEQELEAVICEVRSCLSSKNGLDYDTGADKGDDSDFAASLQPVMSRTASAERLAEILPVIEQKLTEGDSDVLDDLPDLLEIVQSEPGQLDIAAEILELAQVYEFDNALRALKKLKSDMDRQT